MLAYLSAQERTSVNELSQALDVSEVTVRKDLDLLEQQGLLIRVRGGAVVSGRGRLERYFAAREQEHIDEKRRIAQAAASLVHSGQQIFLDGSTTALQVARLIKEREDLVVVTNGLYTALELNFSAGITTIVVGGTMRRRSSSLVGSFNHDLLRRLRFDIGFFGAQGCLGARWADGSGHRGSIAQTADGKRVRQRGRRGRFKQVRGNRLQRLCSSSGDRPDHHRHRSPIRYR